MREKWKQDAVIEMAKGGLLYILGEEKYGDEARPLKLNFFQMAFRILALGWGLGLVCVWFEIVIFRRFSLKTRGVY